MPKLLLSFLLVLFSFVPRTLFAVPHHPDVKTGNAVIIYPNADLSGNAQATHLRLITDNIIGVVASPKKNSPLSHSLVTVYKTSNNQPSFELKKRMVMVKPSFLNQNRKPEFLKTKHCLL